MTVEQKNYKYLKFARPKDGLLEVVLSNPGKLNSVTADGHAELGRVWGDIDRDESVQVVLLRGDQARMVGLARLDEHPARLVAASGPPRDLRQELERALRGTEVGEVQRGIRQHDADQRHAGRVAGSSVRTLVSICSVPKPRSASSAPQPGQCVAGLRVKPQWWHAAIRCARCTVRLTLHDGQFSTCPHASHCVKRA